MNFLIYDKDGVDPGRIGQSNKVYSPEGYDKTLNDHGLTFIAIDHPSYLSPDKYFIQNGAPAERKAMPIQVSKTKIKAGGKDSAVFQGVPMNATAKVTLGDLAIGSAVIPTGAFDMPIPVPCIYRVTITLWPFLDFIVDIEAIA